MHIDWHFLAYNQLTIDQLYSALQMRQKIFTVEQQCLYNECDGFDKIAYHLMGFADGELILYSRIFAPNHVYHNDVHHPEARIGRVAIHIDHRGRGLGHVLMQQCLKSIQERFGKTDVILNAQAHLEQFYTAHGFLREGENFLEDGMPHVFMKRKEQ